MQLLHSRTVSSTASNNRSTGFPPPHHLTHDEGVNDGSSVFLSTKELLVFWPSLKTNLFRAFLSLLFGDRRQGAMDLAIQDVAARIITVSTCQAPLLSWLFGDRRQGTMDLAIQDVATSIITVCVTRQAPLLSWLFVDCRQGAFDLAIQDVATSIIAVCVTLQAPLLSWPFGDRGRGVFFGVLDFDPTSRQDTLITGNHFDVT